MRGFKGAAAIAAAGVAALAMSGCWGMSGFSLSKTKLAPGNAKKSTAVVKVRSHVTSSAKETFFILTGVGVESGLNFSNRGKFDITKKFRKKPRALQTNEELRDRILSSGQCGEVVLAEYENPVSEGRFEVISTPTAFGTGPVTNKQAVSKLRLKQAQLSTIGDDGAQDIGDSVSDVLIAVGSWRDTNENGEVDPSDPINCGGGAVTRINTKFE